MTTETESKLTEAMYAIDDIRTLLKDLEEENDQLNEHIDHFEQLFSEGYVTVDPRGRCPSCGNAIGYSVPSCFICTTVATRVGAVWIVP